ncbi:lysylphosphatidylglycerol synthase transmembrane domain-containing protein [Bifidobacterium pseudocatenulatum]|uniref:lysylphosphatidylglycerol synthase transmembrane domain-containing protein n=1 Tax=Bifidobacterium pseudocatenulatum TaxID=28026 RepID=UPI0022E79DE0|nr:lysylphosphatidylglycerol synthase transmembrane domain-containing protein [Bifidobacterium pseudocatenulatum]
MSHSPAVNKHAPHIDDVPPKRSRDFADLTHAFFALVLGIGVILFSVYLHGTASGVESDVHSAGRVVSWLMDVPSALLQQLAIVCITVNVLIQLLTSKEWLQSVISVVSLIFGFFAVWGISALISNSGNTMLIIPLQSNSTSVGTGLLPDFYAAMASFLTVSGPRRIRSCTKWGWNVLYAVAVLMVVLSWNSLAGVIASYAIGRVIGMLIRFAIGTQNNGAWGSQIAQSLRSIGIDTSLLTRRVAPYVDSGVLKATLDDDLTENSRIYDVVDYDGKQYTVSVLDNQVHAAGYLNQVWQWLRLTGVSMRRDRSSVDAMHHHYAMILGLSNAGLETPRVYGVADYGESSILVFHRNRMPLECNQNTMSDHDMEAFMEYLTTAHHHGFTHRRITPETLSRMENGHPVIAGWHNGDYGSSAPNFALDKVQLLVLLATLNGNDRAIACARRTWGDEQLIDLAPFIQKAAIPASTRALPGWDKHVLTDLRTRISALAPQDVADSMEKVTLSRFSLRSFIAIALLVVAVYVVFTQIQPAEMIKAVRDANLAMALVCVALGFVAWLGSAITLGVFMDSDKRNTIGLYCSQMASGFTAVSMPAGVGPAFVNLQFLRKSGYRSTAATAVMSAVWAVQGGTTIVLLLTIGLFTGRNTLSGMIPTNTLIMVIAIVALVVSAAMAIPPVRHLVTEKYLPVVKAYARNLVNVLARPKELALGIAGALVLNLATGLGFWAALMAFGYHTNPAETTFIFLLANTLGSAVPTPGGLGAVEAVLSVAFTAVGIPSSIAVSATLVYRIAFYWLRIPVGALAMKWLDMHNLI